MSRLKFVTGYVPIEGHPRTAAEYAALGAELAKARIPLRSFHRRLSDCWLHGMLSTLPYPVTHSAGDNPAKNTLDYHVVTHQKTAWLLEASVDDPESDLFVWIDLGVMRLPGVTVTLVESFARVLADRPPAEVTIPGCWDVSPISDEFPCWRFCGGVLICPRRHLHSLDLAVKKSALRRVEETRNVSWEVNTWARVEQSGSVPITWYRADHDETLFTGYGAALRAGRGGAEDPAGWIAVSRPRVEAGDRLESPPRPDAPAAESMSLFSVNYENPRRAAQPEGGLARSFVAGVSDRSGDNIADRPGYADARAMYYAWKNLAFDVVGFHGYRRHINFRGDTAGWTRVSLPHFRLYQEWLAGWDGSGIRSLLREHDVIVTTPYRFGAGEDLTSDFRRSRSARDWTALQDVMGGGFDFHLPYVHNMFFVTSAPLFREYMSFWWGICEKLEPLVTSEDATDPSYKARAMAFLSERIFSLWLHRSGVSYIELPLLVCWEAS